MGESRPVWAHSRNDLKCRHALVDHLRETARLAASFAAPFGGERVAWWLALLHDAGKASSAWQDGLLRAEARGGRVGLDHKSLGALLAVRRGLGKFAVAVDGHHGGLNRPKSLERRLKDLDAAVAERNQDAQRALRALLPELADEEPVALPAAWQADPLVAELALRLVYSALCDADWLDTAAHFAGAPKAAVRADADWPLLRDRFEKRRADLLTDRRPSPIDGIRNEVYEACLEAAQAPPGVFRLAAPTGSGKTLASAGFALHHAARHGLRRVVVAVPFLTITEQNAAEYRRLLDDDGEPAGAGRVVLEHHSGVRLDSDKPERRWERLAAENWDAPFVVTTTVRLFEALFDRKPSAMRRLHRIAGSVLVLDEVQALPHDMLVPILDVLRKLVDHFRTTVLLASATQPDFWHLSPFRTLPGHEIVPDPAELAVRLRRVRFKWRLDPSPTLEEVADEAAGIGRAMVVVNTTADARKVFDRWRTLVPDGVAWHLSKRMCPAHRRRVLAAVRERLSRGEPTLLVSTQLIEAGVDIDFPVVYCVLAPADSLLQAAGRANREGALGTTGLVVIVDPPDASSPPEYQQLVNVTRVHFGPEEACKVDPDDQDALRAYYRSVYGARNLEDRHHVGQRIQAARRRLDFRAVTDGPLDAISKVADPRFAFRMIRDEGISVVTPVGAADKATETRVSNLAEKIRTSPRPDRDALRDLQPYMTTVHSSALRHPGVMALLHPILGEPDQPGALAEWKGPYDKHTGIVLDPGMEEFVQ